MFRPLHMLVFNLTALLTACTSVPEFTRDFAEDKVHPSMSVNEVIQQLGPPDEIETIKEADNSTQTAYRYLARIDHGKGNTLNKEMIIFFRNDKLIKKSYSERIILRKEKDSRPSNNIFQIK